MELENVVEIELDKIDIVGPKGEKGDPGPQGPPGPAGKDGKNGTSIEEVKAITGNLENLNTEDKSNLVSAINESLNSGGGGVCGIVINADNATALEKAENKALFKVWYDNYINGVNIPLILNTVVRDDSFKSHSFMLVNIVNDSAFQRYTLTFQTLQNSSSMDTIFSTDIRVTYNNNEFNNIAFNTDNGYVKCSKFIFAKSNNVLTKANTTAYTPSSNYHPATKKYVDDAILALKAELTGGQ